MGCGASKTADSGRDKSEHGRDKAPPKGSKSKPGTSPAPRQREESTEKYRHEQEEQKDTDEKPVQVGKQDDGNALTVAMVADLRTKVSKEGGSSVMRWIDCIVEPQENDNADVFDPMRRHMLSMESVSAKLQTGVR